VFCGVNLQTQHEAMRYCFICLFALFFVKQGVYAQNTARYLLWPAKEAKNPAFAGQNDVKVLLPLANSSLTQPNFQANEQYFQALLQPRQALPVVFRANNPAVAVAALPSNFYASCLGWVCKQELKMDRKTALPLRFRLGSKEQVDWLEGKSSH
jgi:hypothetical protein